MSEGNGSENISRRNFFELAAVSLTAASLPACNTNQPKAVPVQKPIPAGNPAINVYDILGKYNFTDSNGQPLNVNALKTKLQNQYTTVTFGFSRCEGMCEPTNKNLAEFAKRNKGDISHIIISTDPRDSASQADRDKFIATCASQGMDTSRLTILYPVNREQQESMQTEFSGKAAPKKGPGHIPEAFLHTPSGNLLSNVQGNLPLEYVLEAFESDIVPIRGR